MPDPVTEAPVEAGVEPAAAPAPAAVEAPEAPKEPLSRGDARRRLHTQAAQRQAKIDSERAIREEQDKEADELTASQEEQPGDELKPGEEPAPAAGEEPGAEPGAEPEEKPADFTVDLDPRHPATQGLANIQVKTEQEARVVRTLVNGYVRRQDVEEANVRAQQAEADAAKERDWRLRHESTQKVQSDWRGTKEYAAAVERYNTIREQVGEEAAEEYWQGVIGNLAQQANEVYTEASEEAQNADADRRGDQWAERMWARANNNLAPHITSIPTFGNLFATAARSFNSEIEMGNLPSVNAENVDDEFTRYFHGRLIADPAIAAAIKTHQASNQNAEKTSADDAETAKRAREAIEQEAVEKYKRDIATRRREGPPHPLGPLGATRERDTQGSSEADSDESANMSAHELRKAAKKQAREMTRRRLGG